MLLIMASNTCEAGHAHSSGTHGSTTCAKACMGCSLVMLN